MKILRQLLPVVFLLFSLDVIAGFTFLAMANEFNRSLPPLTQADAGMVFFGDFGTRFGLDEETLQRVSHAAELYDRGVIKYVICVGGVRDQVRPSGIERMRLALVELGVPDKAVFHDRHSFDTLADWKEAERILREHGWQRVVLISSPLHLYRIHHIIKNSPLELHPSPSSRIERDLRASFLRTWQAVHHEWAGWVSMRCCPAMFSGAG